MISGGYIIQPRKFDNSEASKFSPVTRELWFYLLRNVNHSDNGKLKRGQNFFQFSQIQEDLHWYIGYRKMVYSKPQISKALRRLNEGNMTATMKATRGIIVTICNYDYYQDSKNYEVNDEGSTKGFRGSHYKQECKEYKNIKKKKYIKKKKEKKKPTKLILKEKIIENNFIENKDKIFEFFEYRMSLPAAKQYKTEKGLNALFRDLNGCREKGMIISECLDEAMEREWMTPNPDYFKTKAADDGRQYAW